MNAIVEVDNLSFAYNADAILEGLSFSVTSGEFLAIAGPNGVGKTTLLNLLCSGLKPTAGQINIDSAKLNSYPTKELARKVAVVRQEFVPAFDFTVTEVVSMARTPYLGALGFESTTDKGIVTEALEITDTAHLATRSLGQLSGGERQRVFIARALAQSTPIIILDEPTSFLDIKHQVAIYDLLKQSQLEKGKTIIAVTHDINLAMQYCERTLLLYPGKTYYVGKTSEILSQQHIEDAFGVKTFTAHFGTRNIIMPIGKFSGKTGLNKSV
ncbi:MAG: ABC transporter ATP-binding protein [Phycisphaerales bacterium]|jgi:iron complex transport system ATP-binding protein